MNREIMNRIKPLLAVLCLSFLAACAGGQGRFSTPNASGYYADSPVQCVPYAREASGIQIRGDAHTWWDSAAGRYTRGSVPRVGAVFVLANTSRMRHGHLSVVKDIINKRQIDVTHSNWGSDRDSRRVIYEKMRVEDLSTANDWTRVRFWNKDINAFGLPYQGLGFIYP